MPNYATYHAQDIVQGVFDTLSTAASSLGIAVNSGAASGYDVFYGDQTNIPRTPTICVEPGTLTRTLDGAATPPPTLNEFEVLILVYLQELGGIQTLEKSKDLLLDQVVDVMHEDWTLGGLLVFGYCHTIDPGYAMRGNKLMRCGKISYRGMNKSFLINP